MSFDWTSDELDEYQEQTNRAENLASRAQAKLEDAQLGPVLDETFYRAYFELANWWIDATPSQRERKKQQVKRRRQWLEKLHLHLPFLNSISGTRLLKRYDAKHVCLSLIDPSYEETSDASEV